MIELPKSCGINLNLNNLSGELQAQISGYLNLDLGTPAGLASLKGTLESGLNTLKGKLTDLIPIPDLPNISLRDELATLASLPLASTAAAAKIVELAGSFVGITNIAGFANLNLTDLAKSVFSLSGTFDPCALLDGASLPNVMKDPVSGLLKKLPELPPLLGSTTEMLPVDLPIQDIQNNLQAAIKDNLPIVTSQAKSLLNANIADMIPKIPGGLDNVIEGATNFAGGAMPSSVMDNALAGVTGSGGLSGLSGLLDQAKSDISSQTSGLGGMLSGAVSNLTSQATSTASGLAGGLSSVTAAAPGMLQELAADAPALLSELQAQAPDAIAKVSKEVTGAKEALGKNVLTAISGMGDTIRKLPSGIEVAETKEDYLNEVKNVKKPVMVEVPLTGGFLGIYAKKGYREISQEDINLSPEEVLDKYTGAAYKNMKTKAERERAFVVRKYHDEAIRVHQNGRIDRFRAAHPEFDDPSSPDFHKFPSDTTGRTHTMRQVPNQFNGKPEWEAVN